MPKAIFLDTMIYLHYRPIEEIDFAAILGPVEMVLVVPRVTVRELDKHKNTHERSKIRERARKTLLKIEEWQQTGAAVGQFVRVKYYPRTPTIDFAAKGLNPEWPDDYLLATVLEYKKEHEDSSVCLITQDSGPRLTAVHLSVDAVQLSEAYRVAPETDPLEQENLELKKNLAKLQSALPKLTAGFFNEGALQGHARFSLKAPKATPASQLIEEKIAALAAQFPRKEIRHAVHSGLKSSKGGIRLPAMKTLTEAHVLNIPDSEFDRYNKDRERYLEDYRKFLNEAYGFVSAMGRSIVFQIAIANVGTAPADDVDVHFHFPHGFSMVRKSEIPKPPKEPSPPKEPMNHTEMVTEMMRRAGSDISFQMPASFFPRVDPISSFKLKRGKSYDLTDRFTRIKHGDIVDLPEIYLTFNSYDDASSFSCEYALRPANLPGPVTGRLDFIIQKEQ